MKIQLTAASGSSPVCSCGEAHSRSTAAPTVLPSRGWRNTSAEGQKIYLPVFFFIQPSGDKDAATVTKMIPGLQRLHNKVDFSQQVS